MAVPEHPAPSHAHVVVPIGPALSPSDVHVLCEGIPMAPPDANVDAVCDASALSQPDLGTIDGLARLVLALRRLGYDIRLDPAPSELTGLLALVGLADVVPCAGSVVEARREAEHREELLGVEEEDDPADPAA